MGTFYNPQDAGSYDLMTTQQNKNLDFKSTAGVFSDSARVAYYVGNRLVKVSTLDDDISIIGNNVEDEEKTLRLVLNGPNFASYRGGIIEARCTLFTEGDVEVTFKLEIK